MWGTLPRRKKHSRIRSEVKEMPGPAGSGRAGIAPPPLQRAAFWDLTSTMQAYHYAALQAVSLAPWVLPCPDPAAEAVLAGLKSGVVVSRQSVCSFQGTLKDGGGGYALPYTGNRFPRSRSETCPSIYPYIFGANSWGL